MTVISGYYANPHARVVNPVSHAQAATASAINPAKRDPENSKPEAAKPFSQVILDARATLDAGYRKLGMAAGDGTTDSQWRKTIGLDSLDRRALFAIASNQGGQFSQVEASAAQSVMASQESEAMMAADRTGTDFAARFRAAIDYLDSASEEEKATLKWAQSRGTAQAGYLMIMKNEGRSPDDVDSGNPIVNLFARAYAELSAARDVTQGAHSMPSWIKALELWHLHRDETRTISWTL